ncbi:hypothetical protein GJ654_18570 [Rhodoblastus acidophilus]|uniref:Uncharacterized protein n=1 Tax=Rhodoblastus acidophilus TaxID=1074 RepID=A0A6N8DRQ4_RHOAC|nr:hypothetical protein [Rhodoblastus acidophilus]MCW2276327.1 hypothetical protein [Rhodoblastus acidophilus]MTV32988.1 hypothetical protein [Rhodoblastus acidophilus]
MRDTLRQIIHAAILASLKKQATEYQGSPPELYEENDDGSVTLDGTFNLNKAADAVFSALWDLPFAVTMGEEDAGAWLFHGAGWTINGKPLPSVVTLEPGQSVTVSLEKAPQLPTSLPTSAK